MFKVGKTSPLKCGLSTIAGMYIVRFPNSLQKRGGKPDFDVRGVFFTGSALKVLSVEDGKIPIKK